MYSVEILKRELKRLENNKNPDKLIIEGLKLDIKTLENETIFYNLPLRKIPQRGQTSALISICGDQDLLVVKSSREKMAINLIMRTINKTTQVISINEGPSVYLTRKYEKILFDL